MGAGFELGFYGPGSRPVKQTLPKITPPDLRERLRLIGNSSEGDMRVAAFFALVRVTAHVESRYTVWRERQETRRTSFVSLLNWEIPVVKNQARGSGSRSSSIGHWGCGFTQLSVTVPT